MTRIMFGVRPSFSCTQSRSCLALPVASAGLTALIRDINIAFVVRSWFLVAFKLFVFEFHTVLLTDVPSNTGFVPRRCSSRKPLNHNYLGESWLGNYRYEKSYSTYSRCN